MSMDTDSNNNNNKNDSKMQNPMTAPSLLERRRQKQSSTESDTLSLDTTNSMQDSFKVSENSYIRAEFKIDAKGLTRIAEKQNENDSTDNKMNEYKNDSSNTNSTKNSEIGIEHANHKSFINSFDEISMLNVLGQGQSGYVSQAIHIPTKTVMAVKQISIYDRSKRHQIMNELSALYKTKCIGLVNFYDVFYFKGSVYIALEYCECGSLFDIIKKLPNNRIPEIALQIITKNILEGLIHLHSSKSKVHRDLKPANICLNSKGIAKIADFGISRDLKDSLQCRTVVGTVTYMSPERIRGENYDQSSDIWSLGITLFECAIGKFPYQIKKVYWDLIHDIASKPSPELTSEMMNQFKLSKNFKNFLQICLEKDPLKRASAIKLKNHKWIKILNEKFTLNTITNIMEKWINENNLIIPLPIQK